MKNYLMKKLLNGYLVMGVFTWIIKGIICTVIVNIIYFLRYFRTAEFKDIVSKIVKNGNKKSGIVKSV